MKKLPFILLLVVALQSSIGLSQNLDIALERVFEVRSSDPNDNTLTLAFSISGLNNDWAECIRVVEASGFDPNGNRFERIIKAFDTDYQDYEWFSFNLNLPPRDLKKLDLVKLTLKVFEPTEENSSRIRFEGFPGMLNKNLLEGNYENLVLIPMDSLELERTKEKYNAMPESGKLSSIINSLPKQSQISPSRSIHFFLSDPQEQIQEIIVYDGDGKKKYSRGFGYSSIYRSFTYDTEIKEDWTLELIIENEASVEEYYFELKDIELP